MQKSLKSAQLKKVTNAASKKVNISSSMMIMKTGGAVAVESKQLQSATHVVQILRSSMILVKTNKMSKNMVNHIQHQMVLASWKLVTKSSCNTNAMRMEPSLSSRIKTSTLVAVLSVLLQHQLIASTSLRFHF